MHPDFVSKFAKQVATKSGVDTHLYARRHSLATQAIVAGLDPVTVAGRLGHRDSSITLRVHSLVLKHRDRDRDLAHALGPVLAPPARATCSGPRRAVTLRSSSVTGRLRTSEVVPVSVEV